MAQYDFDKVKKENKLSLKWHGEPTLVALVKGEAKVAVNTGDVVEVTESIAKELLTYSSMWTLKNDAPVVHPYMMTYKKALEARSARQVALAKKASKKKGETAPAAPADDKKLAPEALTEADVDLMDTKKAVLEALLARGIKANKNATLDELKAVLKDKLAEENAPEMVDHTITQEDLDANPDLVTEGVKVGDVVQLPKADDTTTENKE